MRQTLVTIAVIIQVLSAHALNIPAHALSINRDKREINDHGSNRTLRGEGSPNLRNSFSDSGVAREKSPHFRIVDRYPAGESGTSPDLVLKPRVTFNVNCSTTAVWHICKWKTPISDDPCAMFKSDTMRRCPMADFQIRHQEVGALHVCSLTGTVDPDGYNQGSWNCDLSSMPAGEQGDLYFEDQQYFNLKTIKAPDVKFSHSDRSSEKELFETEELEMTCTASNGWPEPTIVWFINSQPIKFDNNKFTILKTDGPRLTGKDNFYLKQTIRYTSTLQENGKSISCKVHQTDDENNLSEVFNEDQMVHLFIREIPNPPAAVVTAEMITGIVLVIVALLLALAIVGFAFYTKRWCFSTPIVTVAATKHKETGEMIIQTDEEIKVQKSTSEFAVGTEVEPLLGKAFETQTDMGDFPPDLTKQQDNSDFLNDQVVGYSYEGSGSLAGSLSSIESSQKSVDLEAEFTALGPRFRHLADMFGGQDEDDSDVDSLYIGGEFVI